jgi:hypothetical protein
MTLHGPIPAACCAEGSLEEDNMDPRSALLTQLDSLDQQLLQVAQAVQSQKLEAHLRARVGARFDKLLSRQRTEITNLRDQVSGNQPLQACWNRFRQLDLECRTLFEECLAFIQGALARADDIDQRMCLLADNLLDDLAAWADVGWRRFTLLSTGEFYRDTAEIIRIRFPETTIWGLPIVAHEFGHFLGPELRENQNGGFAYPFQAMLKRADENRPSKWPLPHSTEWHYLHEHFADLFATYSLGPAFATSFILLRLNPVDAFQDSPTHPSHAKRVHSIFWMLERMDQAAGRLMRPYKTLIVMLRELWEQGLQEVGNARHLSDAEIGLLESKLNELSDLLTRTTPTQLSFRLSDWQRSQTVAEVLLSEWWAPGGHSDASRRDLLNAAWLSRLQLNHLSSNRVDVRDIGLRALEMYQRIPPHIS